jgi:hypothetical protein
MFFEGKEDENEHGADKSLREVNILNIYQKKTQPAYRVDICLRVGLLN